MNGMNWFEIHFMELHCFDLKTHTHIRIHIHKIQVRFSLPFHWIYCEHFFFFFLIQQVVSIARSVLTTYINKIEIVFENNKRIEQTHSSSDKKMISSPYSHNTLWFFAPLNQQILLFGKDVSIYVCVCVRQVPEN